MLKKVNKTMVGTALFLVLFGYGMGTAFAADVACRAYTLQDGSVALECYEIGVGNGK